jgi:hypothetical protein
MKRFPWLLLATCATLALAEEHHGHLAWVEYDSATKTTKLSTGAPADSALTPGQYVGHREWRSPLDIIVAFPATNGVSRVAFSHERHFGALGAKNCKACHAEDKGLGSGNPLPSFAATPALEPHGARSRGRFCANCHRENFTAKQIEGATPPGNAALFSALGHKGDETCNRCHVPVSHGADFTGRHGDQAEHGAKKCATCHRGAGAMTKADQTQAQAYREAQLALVKNSEDTAAFQKVLPNSFCAYCHGASRRGHRGDD